MTNQRTIADSQRTPFTTIVDIMGVVTEFVGPTQLVLQLRLVCDRWRLAVADVLHKLKCRWRINCEQLARLAAEFLELQTLDLTECSHLNVAGFRSLRGLGGLKTLVLRGHFDAKAPNVTDAVLGEVAQIATLASLDIGCCDTFTSLGLTFLSRLPRLETLDVSNNEQLDAAAFAVLALLPALKSLSISGCVVTDDALSSVCNAVRLTSLNLSSCNRLTGAGSAHLPRLTALQTLALPFQADDAWLAVVGCLTSLTSLDSRSCNVTDVGVEKLSLLVGLTELNMSRIASLTDRSLTTVGRFTRLAKLTLTFCDSLTDEGVKQLRGLTALKKLHLDGVRRISDEAMKVAAEFSLLETLVCGECPYITDAGLMHVATLKNLRCFDVCNNLNITDSGVAAVARLPRLSTLRLAGCTRITENALKALRGAKTVRELQLDNCKLLTVDALAFVGEIRTLIKLTLDGCSRISEAAFFHLRGLPSLRELSVRNTRVTDDQRIASLCAAVPGLRVFK